MSVLGRKLLRELRSSAGLVCAVASIIVVGTACFISMGSAYRNLRSAKNDYYARCRMADFTIELKKAPLAEVEAVRELPGVSELNARIQFSATVDLPDVPEPLNATVLSLPDTRKPVLNDIVLRRGGYFTERRENEVIVNDAFARAHGLEPGDWIYVILNNRRQALFIVGTAISSEFVYLLGPGAILPDPEHFGVLYLKHSYAEDVFDFEGATNQLLGRLARDADPRATDALLARAEALLEDFGVFSTTPLRNQASNAYLSNEIAGLWSFAIFMPVSFLSVAAVVLNVLMTRLAEQQRTVMGTLKAIGYSDQRLFLHFVQFACVVGLLGGVAGGILGYWLGTAMTVAYRQVFEFPELRSFFYWDLTAIGVLVSVACAVAGGWFGSRKVLRLQPAEAMRPKPPRAGGAVFLERFTQFWSRLDSTWRMVIRGVVRARFRTAAGIVAASAGAGMLVSGFMMAEATYFLIDFQFKWIARSDYDLSLKDEKGDDALAELSRLPGVDLAEPLLSVACTFHNGRFSKKAAISGLKSNAQLTVPHEDAARPISVPEVGLVLGRKLAEILHVEEGDMVAFEPVKGLRRTRRVPVVRIVDGYLGLVAYANIGYLSRLVGEEFTLNGAQLRVNPEPSTRRALLAAIKELPAVQSVVSRKGMIRNMESTFIQNLWIFVGMLIVFAGVVFFGGILNSALVSLSERRREIATLRVLGYGTREIGHMLFRENMIVVLAGTLLGMPLGYAMTWAVAVMYDTEMFRFPVVYSLGTFLWTLALAIGFTLAAHVPVQRTINRLDWLEALQAKE